MQAMRDSIDIITVSGLPGSGTTSSCKLVVEQLGWAYINAGQIFRQLAEEAGLSLAEFGRRAEEDGRIDRQLDACMVESAGQLGRVVMEGRLTGWMAHRYGLPALKVWFEAASGVRSRRIAGRDELESVRALREMEEREDSEAKRYREFHDIDLGDRSIYDLVIDTQKHSATEAAEVVLARLQEVRA
jgi:predicted cytidylate kinase